MNKSLSFSRYWLSLVIAATAIPAASAQESFPACQSRESLNRMIEGTSADMTDECRLLEIRPADDAMSGLCVVEITDQNEDLIDLIAAPAIPERWWVRCADLSPTSRPLADKKE